MKTNNYQYWEQHHQQITTSVGKWVAGDDVTIRGNSLFKDLFGKYTYTQIMVLNATGKLIEKNVADWIEGNFMGTSYPDSRLWCNHIGSLGGTSGSSGVASITAGILCAESRVFGGSITTKTSVEFIKKALCDYNAEQGIDEKAIVDAQPIKHGRPYIVGFARPVLFDDERIAPYERLREKLNIEMGPHLSLAFKISAYLEKSYGMGINSGGYSAAFLADQGFSAEDTYYIKALAVSSGVAANTRDWQHQPHNTFLPLKCNDIEYKEPEFENQQEYQEYLEKREAFNKR